MPDDADDNTMSIRRQHDPTGWNYDGLTKGPNYPRTQHENEPSGSHRAIF